MPKKKGGTNKVITELRDRLLIQAERLGTREKYNPLWFLEQKVLSLSKILAEFYAERSNLEYELNILGTDKKDILVKLEKLYAYIRKAEKLKEKYTGKFEVMIDKDFELSANRKALSQLQKADVKAYA